MNEVVKSDKYIKMPPGHETKVITPIRLGIYANSIEIEDGMNMDVNMYLRQNWEDPRLAYDEADYDGDSDLTLPDEAWKSIWIPDIFFRNEKQVTRLHDTGRENVLLKVNSTGFLWFVIKMTAKLTCPMQFQKYPFDKQSCPIMMESFRYTSDIVTFSWLQSAFEIDPSLTSMKGFILDDTNTHDCSQNYTGGSFPCLEIRLLLTREAGTFGLKLFFPSILLVCISWLNFWMPFDKYPERIAVLLIIILMMLVQYGIVSLNVAQVSYLRCMDVWIVISVLFVFLAMLEATIVKAFGAKSTQDIEESRVHNPQLANRLDTLSRCIFPLIYLLFLIIFFAIYN